jgi:hypothetical protein
MPTRDLLIILAIFALGVLLLWAPVKARLKRRKAMNWTKTKATVLTSEIVEDQLRTATGQIGTGFFPEVTYKFHAAGREYNGSRISFGNLSLNYTEAESVKSKFVVDSETDVYYDPENPEDCALAPQAKRGLKSLIPGIFVVATSFLVLIIALVY